MERIYFGGGCFWCTEAAFNNLVGVISVIPGYSGGTTINPTYEEVCSGETGHAEVIQVIYEPDKITLEQLLDVFFLVHDPTSVNRQGNDIGTQYRSIIITTTEKQHNQTIEYMKVLATQYDVPLATKVENFTQFYPAEKYHHNYYERNNFQMYCQVVITPKLKKLRDTYMSLLKTH